MFPRIQRFMTSRSSRQIQVLLTRKNSHFPILVWDKAGEKLFRVVLDGLGPFAVLDIDSKLHVHIRYMPLSIIYFLQAIFETSNNKGSAFLRRQFTSVSEIIRVAGQCLNISMALSYRPKIILTYTDDSRNTQLMDAILHRHIPVISIQNGRRWHCKSLLDDPRNALSYIAPGFHSCFAALSPQEADSHRKAKWLIDELYVIGSINAAVTLRKAKIDRYLYDICIIENSEEGLTRQSNSEMVKLINSYYSRNRHLRVCVALKRNNLQPGYQKYFNSVRKLYDSNIDLIPRNINGSSVGTTLSSHLTIGVLSTLLIETFGMGGKIYPLNFEHQAYDSAYDCLNLNMRPTSVEFDAIVDELLSLDQTSYIRDNAEAMQYIGGISITDNPILLLRGLVKRKLQAVSMQIQG